MPLIRNNEEVNPEFRDPEKILSRSEHFWSGHGRVAQDMLSPYEKGLRRKSMWFETDEDQNPRSTKTGGHADVLYEGAVDSLYDNALSVGDFPEGGIHRSGASNLYVAAAHLSPFILASDDASLPPEDLRSKTVLYHPSSPITGSTNIPKSSDPSEATRNFDQRLRAALQQNRERVTQKFSDPKDNFGPAIGASMVPELVRTHSSRQKVERLTRNYPNMVSPKYLGVHYGSDTHSGRRIWASDVIDLETGSWAKVSPDQFFPDYD